jgi:hypothetical protein
MTRTAFTTLTAAALLSSALLSAQSGPYAKVTEIKIGGQGGHDYLAVDPGTRRLFISNSTQMVVIDIDKNAVVGTIADTPRVHGIAFTPAGKGFTSNGGENKASIVDLKTLAVSGKVDIGPGPDSFFNDTTTTEIYTFNHSAGTATVVKADTGAMVATIKLSRDERSRPASRIRASDASSSTSKPTAPSTRSTSRRIRSWPRGPSRRRRRAHRARD